MRKTPKEQLLNKKKGLLLLAAMTITVSTAYSSEVKVCAVPQVYSALESLHEISPVDYSVKYGTSGDILSWITNNQEHCELVLSSDEKLPILLIRAQKAQAATMHSFIRAPLLLWSADPRAIDANLKVITGKKLRSLSIPRSELTPVGFAARMITSRKEFPTGYLEGRIYHTDQEYQSFSLIKSGVVQAGFITKPLVIKSGGRIEGSYWQVPREMYPDLLYYEVLTQEAVNNKDAETFYNLFRSNKKVENIFTQAGFEPLSPRSDFVPPSQVAKKPQTQAEKTRSASPRHSRQSSVRNRQSK